MLNQYLIPIVSSLIVWASVYALTSEQDPAILIEKKNRESVESCISSLGSYTGSTVELQKELGKCAKLELQYITWTVTPPIWGVPPSKWYTKKHTLVLTWSHDYRIYSSRNGAVWKNNNPSGITWWVSNVLKWLWNESWIDYKKWTLRPKNEWWNYVLFWSIEHWLRAKMISIRERWKNATVEHFLWGWWTDYVSLSFDKSKKIKDLSEWEFMELFIQQLKKESPWLIDELVKDKILVVE